MSTNLRAALERLRDKLPDEWHPWASEQADEAHGYNDALHRVVEVINEEIEALAATPEPAPTLDVERLEAAIYNLVVNEGHGWPRSAVGLPNFVAGVAAEYARLQREEQK